MKNIFVSICACLGIASTAHAQLLVFETNINGGATPQMAGDVYSQTQFAEDTTFSSLVSGTQLQLINLTGAFGDNLTIGAGGVGLTTTTPDWEARVVGTSNAGARHALRYELGVGTTDFKLGDLQILVSGVTGDGIGATVAYDIGGTFLFKTVDITSNGTHTISLADDNIIFGDGTTGLSTAAAPSNFDFRVLFYDPAAGSGFGNAIVESVTLYTIPEPSTYALALGLLSLAVLTVRRRLK